MRRPNRRLGAVLLALTLACPLPTSAAERHMRWVMGTYWEIETPGVSDHPAVASSLQRLGQLYLVTTRVQKAIPLLERALEIRQSKLGQRHVDTWES